MNKTLWLRAETKPYEHRTPLIPAHAAELVLKNNTIIVESSSNRIFTDAQYIDAGCEIVEASSWQEASKDAYILGIKELPSSEDPISHNHIYFGHVYKDQDGAKHLLERFNKGNGLLYDLEFLTNEHGDRITSFSHWAGIAGCAIALLIWLQKKGNSEAKFQIPEFYSNEYEVVELLRQQLNSHNSPTCLIIGARGHCAHGVIEFLEKIGLTPTLLYKKDTVDRKEFPEIFQHDILFNCVYLTKPLAPFITKEKLTTNKKLSIVVDISCDPNGPNNPLPIYDKITTFKKPTLRVCEEPHSVDIIAIDHLPSFFPRESSIHFSNQFQPYLKQLLIHGQSSPAWDNAEKIFHKSVNNILEN